MRRVETNPMAKARILVVTGPGKGKTTAALGIAMRSLAGGRRVLLTRFTKAAHSGEVGFLDGMAGLAILGGACGMTPPPEHPDFSRHAEEAARLFAETRRMAGDFDTLILDEMIGVVARGMVPEAEVVAFLSALRPDQVAVLTGRGATPALIAAADTVSEILDIKHGYRRGIHAQEGVEL